MPNNISSTDFQELITAFLGLKSTKDAGNFLIDLCTPMEIKEMCERWKVARLLAEGIPYRQISQLTGTSTTTVTRVARALHNGDGGYSAVLKKYKAKRK